MHSIIRQLFLFGLLRFADNVAHLQLAHDNQVRLVSNLHQQLSSFVESLAYYLNIHAL